jgi:DNA-binding HxlR family transcriptional regulator
MEDRCGLDVSLPYISGKWKPVILFHLQCERRRFGELRRLVVGISEKVLIQQLKELVIDGIVKKHVFDETIPRVEYEITDFGRSLVDALKPLCEWGNANRDRPRDPDTN